MNKVCVTGRITKDVEIKNVGDNSRVVHFSIAVDGGKNTKTNERTSYFFDCEAWNNQAEFLANYVKKGNLLGVSGRLKQETWQSEGKTQSRTIITVEGIENYTPRETTEAEKPSNMYDAMSGIANKPEANDFEVNAEDLPF